ncbi:MAG TPA: DUF4288 domain-containing protein [Tepidisphaeraceae bacterium]|nr:DUF4288 domain-containing protein [Tepidisphaeraceae bacterium]
MSDARPPDPPQSDARPGRWYVAILVLESRVGGRAAADEPPSVDVQYRLVRAPDAEAAYRRAVELGAAAEQSYANTDGDPVSWRFAGLQDLRWVDDQALGDGAEVYAFIEDGSAADRVMPKERLTEFRGR